MVAAEVRLPEPVTRGGARAEEEEDAEAVRPGAGVWEFNSADKSKAIV